MITYGKMPWSFIKFSQLILEGKYRDQFKEFVCVYWGLKGQKQYSTQQYRLYLSLSLFSSFTSFSGPVCFFSWGLTRLHFQGKNILWESFSGSRIRWNEVQTMVGAQTKFSSDLWVYMFFSLFHSVHSGMLWQTSCPTPAQVRQAKVVLTIKTDNVTSCTRVDSHQQFWAVQGQMG